MATFGTPSCPTKCLYCLPFLTLRPSCKFKTLHWKNKRFNNPKIIRLNKNNNLPNKLPTIILSRISKRKKNLKIRKLSAEKIKSIRSTRSEGKPLRETPFPTPSNIFWDLFSWSPKKLRMRSEKFWMNYS